MPDYGAGHITWDLIYPDRVTAEVARKSELWTDVLLPALDEHCSARSALGLDTVGAGAREPGLRGGVKRTAFFRMLPDVAPGLDVESGAQVVHPALCHAFSGLAEAFITR